MKRKILFSCCLLSFTIVVSLSNGGLKPQLLYAQEQMEDVVYFTDGSTARGTIIHMNRDKIRIKQTDGTIIERPLVYIYRFSSKRHFREIYQQAVELENRKFRRPYKDR